MHVITANKGPIAHAYAELREEAARAGVAFRFESTVMDGAPVFNMVRFALPGVEMTGFTGVLNSTARSWSKPWSEGGTMEEGVADARADGHRGGRRGFDIDGWDSAAKTAALANVLLDARTTPLAGRDQRHRPADARARPRAGLRGQDRAPGEPRQAALPRGIRLRVRAEVLPKDDLLASVRGTSNLLLLHTDLMGTLGTVSIAPGVDQTAYGVFSDLVGILR